MGGGEGGGAREAIIFHIYSAGKLPAKLRAMISLRTIFSFCSEIFCRNWIAITGLNLLKHFSNSQFYQKKFSMLKYSFEKFEF